MVFRRIHFKRGSTLVAILLSGWLSGCHHQEPNVIYMPDMVYSPALKAQQPGVRLPVEGTVSRDFQRSVLDGKVEIIPNPLRSTPKILERGEAVYNTFCIVCHGKTGEGDGSIVPKFPRPPSLHSDKVRGWSDGQIFQVITQGQNLMPSYASQISAGDRWAAIHYVRVLQKSKHPTAEDVHAAEQESN